MDLLEQIRGNFPKTIDKDKPVFSSLIVNDEGTASIQKQLSDVIEYMKEWISTPNIYDQTGVMLEKTVNFFSFLERYADETETSLKNRFKAIFVRNHDKRWGTAFDVKNVFKQYFPHATIYVVENTNKIDDVTPGLANMFVDGDISTSSPTAWSLSNCVASSYSRFSKAYGIEMNQANSVLKPVEDIEVTANKTYFIHFFLNGEVNVIIKDNQDKYWNYESKEWEDSIVKNSFSTAILDQEGNITSYDWDNRYLFFKASENTTSVEITFEMKGVGQKASAEVQFTRGTPILTDTVIPSGTRVSNTDGTLVFVTTEDAVITKEQTTSNLVKVVAEEFGLNYIIGANDINKIVGGLDDISVDNPERTAGGTYLDYFRMFAKQPYGSFTVIAHFEGNTSMGVFGLAPGDDDPDPLPQPKYSRYGYYDKSFLSGIPIGFASDIYEDLLDYLRAQGVRAFLEIVIRDYSAE